MKSRWMLSRGRPLAGVLCQVRARQASKQSERLVRSCSHSVPAIHRDFMEDGNEPTNPNTKKLQQPSLGHWSLIFIQLILS